MSETKSASEAAPAEAAALSAKGIASALNVLVADDAFAGRQLLSQLLKQFARCRIQEARNGAQAVSDFAASRPHITFLDIDMPEKNGMAALQEIRAADPNAFVVMVSAISALPTVQEALKLGASGFVVKPYNPQRILDILKKYSTVHGADALLRAL